MARITATLPPNRPIQNGLSLLTHECSTKAPEHQASSRHHILEGHISDNNVYIGKCAHPMFQRKLPREKHPAHSQLPRAW